MKRVVPTLALLALPNVATARVHPRFEPTDLELEDSGVAEIDLQLGPVQGQNAGRIVTPDFELDLGIAPGIELDLDGAFAIEGGHRAPDNLWPSVKLGLYDSHDPRTDRAWAIGVQVGPKLPVANDAHGVGIEGLVLVGRMIGPLHLVLDLGALDDPRTGTSARPRGLEAGVDVELELRKDTWSLLGEIGGVHYLSDDPAQLAATAGVQYSPTPMLDVSLVALVGFAAGSDPFGVLIGISPKLALW